LSWKWKHGTSRSEIYAISFLCVKLGDNATTTHGKLQVFGDNALSRAQAFYWHKIFSEGRNLVEDK
jgi:hypothetical protein